MDLTIDLLSNHVPHVLHQVYLHGSPFDNSRHLLPHPWHSNELKWDRCPGTEPGPDGMVFERFIVSLNRLTRFYSVGILGNTQQYKMRIGETLIVYWESTECVFKKRWLRTEEVALWIVWNQMKRNSLNEARSSEIGNNADTASITIGNSITRRWMCFFLMYLFIIHFIISTIVQWNWLTKCAIFGQKMTKFANLCHKCIHLHRKLMNSKQFDS